MQSKDRTK